MKKIHLLRHAKSSWDHASLADIERPLNERGIRTCQLMAPHINDAGCHFTHVFCSPAVRAQSTIELMSKCLPGTSFQWQIDNALYSFNSDELHLWCQKLDESIPEVFIVGHNPALTDFCNELSHSQLKNIPTSGYVQLVAKSKCTWQQLSETPFKLIHFLRPNKLLNH